MLFDEDTSVYFSQELKQLEILYQTFFENFGFSCSITWRNEYYIFGGAGDNKRQISKLAGCQLSSIGALPFDFYAGGCS